MDINAIINNAPIPDPKLLINCRDPSYALPRGAWTIHRVAL